MKKVVNIGSTWKHSSGIVYKVLLIANTEGDQVKEKYPATVVYQGPNGKVWSGRLDDWHRRMTLEKDFIEEL